MSKTLDERIHGGGHLRDTGLETCLEHEVPDDTGAEFGHYTTPAKIDRYAVQRRVGRGAMGEVFCAYDDQLGRRVAVKLLHPQPRDRQGRRHRMRREAQAMARVSHRHVVQVYETGDFEGRTFITMEFVEGQTLERWRQAQTRSLAEVLDAYRQAGKGLAAAHRAGVLHRDFKPSNALIEDNGWVRVTDFGLAAWISDISTHTTGERGVVRQTDDDQGNDSRLTRAGDCMGTPAFMSPEQHLREPLDARSDQFSFCVALYEAVVGVHPFGGPTRADVREAVLRGEIRSAVGAKRLPRWLRRVLMRGLSVDKHRRWPSMDALLQALRPPGARMRRWAAPVGVALASAGTFMGLSQSTPDLCDGGQAALERVWHPARLDSVRAGLAPIEGALDRARRDLDSYGTRWVAARTRVCEATRVVGEQSEVLLDHRMTCLDLRLQAMNELLEAFDRADLHTAQRVVPSIARLPSIEACETLAGERPELERPYHAEAARLRSEMVAGRAQMSVGHFAKAHGRFDSIAREAAALSLPALEAEAQLRRGQAERMLGRIDEAVDTLHMAMWNGLAAGHDDIALEAAIEHLEMVGITRSDRTRIADDVVQLDALLKRADSEAELRIDALRVSGAVLARHGEYGRGAHRVDEALVLARETYGVDHSRYLQVLNASGTVALWSGRPLDAEHIFEQVLSQDPLLFDPDRFESASSVNSLGVALAMQGELGLAGDRFEQAYLLRLAKLGPGHVLVADSLLNVAGTMQGQGELQQALDYIARARAIYAARLGGRSPKVNDADLALVLLLDEQGRDPEAEQINRRVLERQRAALGPDHPDLVLALAPLGRRLVRREQTRAEGVELLRQAVVLERAKVTAAGKDPTTAKQLVELLEALAQAQRDHGRPAAVAHGSPRGGRPDSGP